MEYTMRRTIQVELEGVTFHMDVETDSAWSEWYPEAIRVDDSERDISKVLDWHAPDLLMKLQEEGDKEIQQLIQERAMSWMV